MSAFSTQTLLERFSPIFTRLKQSAAKRDQARLLPKEEVGELARLGFGALRVPKELGGLGASMEQLFLLLEHLAAADSNVPQAMRQHFFRVEMLLLHRHTEVAQRWLTRVAAGELFGNATTEPHGGELGEIRTVVRRDGSGWRLNGRKIYSTGNAYAQWIPVAAVDEGGEAVVAVVATDAKGVSVLDDWDGFGQRLTGTDTTVFENVFVKSDDVTPLPVTEAHHGAGFHQMVLVAVLAGIGRSARADLITRVGALKRVYFTGTGVLPARDPIIQEAVGAIASSVEGCSALAAFAASSLAGAWRLWEADGGFEAVDRAFVEAEIGVGMAQVVLSREIVDVCGRLFDCLGASSTLRPTGLDRYWRNARTVATHNSPLFKARVVGDYLLNGTQPKIFRAGHDVGNKGDIK